jgi:hypothetical protein
MSATGHSSQLQNNSSAAIAWEHTSQNLDMFDGDGCLLGRRIGE